MTRLEQYKAITCEKCGKIIGVTSIHDENEEGRVGTLNSCDCQIEAVNIRKWLKGGQNDD